MCIRDSAGRTGLDPAENGPARHKEFLCLRSENCLLYTSYPDRILYFTDGHIISELQRHDAERRHFYEAIMQESARQDEKR